MSSRLSDWKHWISRGVPPEEATRLPTGSGAAQVDSCDEPPLGIRDRGLLAILLLTVALQALSWQRLEGYELADSVEYMERALSLARGEPQDGAHAVRSFGFSILLSPFFFAAELLGIEDGRPVVWAVRAFQMLLGLGLVAVSARIGARLAGRRAGLAAGFLAAVNPIFLQYTVTPVSGVAAALFTGLGIERLMIRARPRRSFAGGLVLGAAFLMAYQTVLIALPLLFLVCVRDRRRGARKHPALAAAGVGVCILFQVWLDRVTWGAWGASLGNYLVSNTSAVVVTLLARLGLRDAALWVYERAAVLADFTIGSTTEELRQKQPRAYYFTEIDRMLVWPVAALGVLGVLRACLRPAWRSWILILVFAANAGAMSLKGAKDFRLWLPLLPAIAPVCAYGWSLLAAGAGARWSVVRAALGWLVLASAAALGVAQLLHTNARRHGVYWRAVELVNRSVARERAEAAQGAETVPRARLASAYHWAVFHRESPAVELVKLPHHLDHWAKLDGEQRAACFATLSGVDWLLSHLPILRQEQSLFDAISGRFELVDFFWEPATDPALGPVFVLRRRTGVSAARLLCESLSPEDPETYRRRLGLDRTLLQPLDFLGRSASGSAFDQRLSLLGWEYEVLPESGFGWITYHWTTPTGLASDYTVIDRLTAPDGKHAWQNNHRTCYGFFSTDRWQPGGIVREAYPVLPGSDPFTERFQPLGGPYRRGELIPLELWMAIVRFDENQAYAGGLRPAAFGAPQPLDMSRPVLLPGNRRRSSEGYVESHDKLVRVGGFLLPVHLLFRWPDDGRGDPP